MNTVAIVNYGLSNVDSVARAVEECGGRSMVTADPDELGSASFIILPGVGAFPDAMKRLHGIGMVEALREHVVERKIPFLGICLGMQLLATSGWEGEQTPGFGWIEGEVRRMQPVDSGERLPHIGWNEVHPTHDNPLFRDVPAGSDFYFVHSYALVCRRPEDVLARTPYCGGFTSSIMRGNIFGTQFHPEKSQKGGFQLLRNFLNIRGSSAC